jgi:hypothetical protein
MTKRITALPGFLLHAFQIEHLSTPKTRCSFARSLHTCELARKRAHGDVRRLGIEDVWPRTAPMRATIS